MQAPRYDEVNLEILFMDPRYLALARNLVSHSTNLQPGENVLLHAFDIPEKMTIALIRAVRERNAIPFVQVQSALLDRECILGGTKQQFDCSAHWEMERMQKMDAYIAIRGSNNVFENSFCSSFTFFAVPSGEPSSIIRILNDSSNENTFRIIFSIFSISLYVGMIIKFDI